MEAAAAAAAANKEQRQHRATCEGALLGGAASSKHKEQGAAKPTKEGHGLLCEQDGCSTVATFNFEGLQRRRFCFQHKVQGMVNLVQKRCEHAGCSEAPHFNFDGGKGGRFYAQHKLEGMVCLAHKRHGPVIQTQTYRVILKLPLGLEFEDQNPPVGLPGVYVKSVREGLSAALSGEVRPGDRLIAVSASPGGSKEMVGCATVRDVISAFNKVKANQSVLLQLEHPRAHDETYSPPPEKGGIRGSRKRIPSCLQKRRHDLCLQQGCQKVKSFGWRKDEANGGGGQRKFCYQHKMAGMVNLRQPPTRIQTISHHHLII